MNRPLQDEIARNHLAISQFPSGTRVGKHTFPIRNKTMALISDATVIVEATDDSGSLHQGWEATRLGRPLFLAKSIFHNQELTFPHKLADYGAEVLTGVDRGNAGTPTPTPAEWPTWCHRRDPLLNFGSAPCSPTALREHLVPFQLALRFPAAAPA